MKTSIIILILVLVAGAIISAAAMLKIRDRTPVKTAITFVLGIGGAWLGAGILAAQHAGNGIMIISGVVVAAALVSIFVVAMNRRMASAVQPVPTAARGPHTKSAVTEGVKGPATAEQLITTSSLGSGVFISYRRDDESNFAGRLYERLLRNYTTNRVFMDVDTIELGVDFSQAIDDWLNQISVMLVVIGNKWLDCKAPDGSRRLDNPDDFVRIEVARALARSGVRVIPVLVDGASVPNANDLPDPLKPLARRNGLSFSHAGFGSDFERLSATLQRFV
jgi:hypothetical protein